MKALSLLLLIAVGTLRAGEAELPKFDSKVIDHPPLSLGETGKVSTYPRMFDYSWPTSQDPTGGLLSRETQPAIGRIAPPPPRFTPKTGPWKMPILEPNPKVDHKIVLKEPSSDIDPKMVIGVKGLDAKATKAPEAP